MSSDTLPPGLEPPRPKPWNKREFLSAMRRNGWKCISYVPLVYQSKDDPTVTFHPNKYDVDRHGWAWEVYAVRHETPPTRRAR